MAQSHPEDLAVDLTKCGICKEIIIDPRALPCLHTFCLDCLREWAKRSTETVTCPSCKKVVTLPAEGVDGLPGNFFVSSLMERSLSSPTKTQRCVCCGEDVELLARCVDCNGFLCQKGVDLHKTFLMVKGHQVISMDDLKSGKVDVRKLSKPPTCSKHKDQTLWLFCETCGVLICRDCTVLNHCRPEHKYEDLANVVDKQKEKLGQLDRNSDVVAKEINDDMERIIATKFKLDAVVTQASLQIEEAANAFKTHIERSEKDQKEQLYQWKSKITERITKTTENLGSQSSRLETAKAMTKQVLSTGSDCDVASMYSQLSSSLEVLSKRQPIPQTIALYDVQFKANATPYMTLGTLKLGVPECTRGTWVLQKIIGDDGPGKLEYAREIAVTPDGDIAVTSFNYSSIPVKVFTLDGQFKFTMDKRSANAWNIAIAGNDKFFVTTGNCKYVNVFNAVGEHLQQFPTVSPDGASSEGEADPNIRGVAVNGDGNVFLGETKKKYISIHNQDGRHKRSIKTTIFPRFISVTQDNRIIVSSYGEGVTNPVHVYDSSGEQICAICAPEGVRTWDPTGVCTTQKDEICIANTGKGENGIYCFTSDGKYLGCIIKDVTNPMGIALTENGDNLVVVDNGKCVKIFTHRY